MKTGMKGRNNQAFYNSMWLFVSKVAMKTVIVDIAHVLSLLSALVLRLY